MKRLLPFLMLIALPLGLVSGQERTPPPKNIPDSINYIWKSISADFIALADAMPEDKWSFGPTQGEFKQARTFAQQVKHVACANEAWAKQVSGGKPPERCDLGGPNPAKSKAEIMAYLRDSVAQVDKAIAASKPENLLQENPGPYWGTNRLSALVATVWHLSDHYGQLVLYARMNGVVPPASR